jgi:hypothetical protein
MKPIGALYHAPLLRERDEMRCQHGATYLTDCSGRIPPRCCWDVSDAALESEAT